LEAGAPFCRFAQHLGAIAERHCELAHDLLHVGSDRTEVAARNVGGHIDLAGLTLAVDVVRRRLHPDIRHIGQAHRTGVRRVDQELLDVLNAVPRFGRAPELDIIGLAVPEDVSRFLTGQKNA
jgi:hypothetical protein